MSKKKNEIGNRYGRLIVLEMAGRDKRGASLWTCLCDCGKEVVVAGGHLRSGNTKSCGCLRTLPFGLAAFNVLYYSYKSGARRRGLVFSLTKEDFSFLTRMNCFYCGTEPSQMGRRKRLCASEYIYNGIDRIDNTKGYTMENVVPCCGLCNWMKKDLSVSKFREHILRIATYRER